MGKHQWRWCGMGTTHTVHQNELVNRTSVGVADVDGDGDPDVVGAEGSVEVSWWENLDSRGTSWTQHVIDGFFGSGFSVDVADVDGDGDVDVMSASFTSGEIGWWANLDGNGTFGGVQRIAFHRDRATAVLGADIDQDGDVDALSTANGIALSISWVST